ncbi:MAG: hypothetical protein PXZ08_04010 [Actinomycetota bacterium]|nr:hypothetical protein [Actinomycetota bacterium]
MSYDRYRLDQFHLRHTGLFAHTELDQQLLGDLLGQSELVYSSSKWRAQPLLRAIPLHVHLANSTSANVGRILVDLEIELRRAASYLGNGSLRPSRDNQMVEVLTAQHSSSIDIVVAAAMNLYSLLTSRPIDFLLLLDWFWSHRHNRTKVRLPYEETVPTGAWDDIVAMAGRCIEVGRPVVVTVVVESDGSTKFGFRSLGVTNPTTTHFE